MKEAVALLEKAERFLRSAAVLLAHDDAESAVSRTYYAMSHAAQAALLTRGITAGTHGGVVRAFGREFVQGDRVPRTLGRDLNRALELRQLADYQPSPNLPRDTVAQNLERGRAFVAEISRTLGVMAGD